MIYSGEQTLRWTPIAGSPPYAFFGPVDLPPGHDGPFVKLDLALFAELGHPEHIVLSVRAAS